MSTAAVLECSQKRSGGEAMWFKVDDQFFAHRKAVAAGLSPLGLWVIAGSWCGANGTDGFVPDHVLPRLANRASKLARQLEAADLWERVDGGYQFHDWLDFNPAAESVTRERAENAQRAALHRHPEVLAEIRERDGDRCRYCGKSVNWRDRRSGSGGTYDAVDLFRSVPEPVTSYTFVTTCRSCKNARAQHDPEHVEMQLLPPKSQGTGGAGGPQNQIRSRTEPEDNSSSARTVQDPDPTRVVGGPDRGGVAGGQRARAHPRPPQDHPGMGNQNTTRPAERCPTHAGIADPPNCRHCAAARRDATDWDHNTHLAKVMTNRKCPFCDAEGWRYEKGTRIPRTPYLRCDHQPP